METKSERRKRLRETLPHGQLSTKSALKKGGFTLHQIDNFLKSETLMLVAPGVYKTPSTNLSWEGVVASLYRLGFNITVGGLTSLELSGYGHYLNLAQSKVLHLHLSSRLPSWVEKALPDVEIKTRTHSSLFPPNKDRSDFFTLTHSADHPALEFQASKPELAILEFLQDVPKKATFEHADLLMEGLTTLSPKRLDKLLLQCKSVRVKRMFLWLANRHKHAWFNSINSDRYDLGKGKRVLALPGKLDKQYLITVPKDMHAAPE